MINFPQMSQLVFMLFHNFWSQLNIFLPTFVFLSSISHTICLIIVKYSWCHLKTDCRTISLLGNTLDNVKTLNALLNYSPSWDRDYWDSLCSRTPKYTEPKDKFSWFPYTCLNHGSLDHSCKLYIKQQKKFLDRRFAPSK